MERTQKLTPYGSGPGAGISVGGHGLLRAVCILPRKMPNENNKNWLSMKLRMVGESRVGEGEERERKRSGRERGSKRVCPCVLVCACLLLAAGHKTVAYFAAVKEKYVSAAKQKFGQHDYDIM